MTNNDIKERLRPILKSFNRTQLVICWRMSQLPRGDFATPGDFVLAVAELGSDPAAVEALSGAVNFLTHKPSFAEVIAIAEMTKDLNRVLGELRRRNGPTPRFGFKRGPRAMR